MAPTGKDIPDTITLDIVSAISKIATPDRKLPGNKNLWLSPTNLFIICGAIKPINPIIPKNDTQTAVINDAKNKLTIDITPIFTPIVLAVSKPLVNAS